MNILDNFNDFIESEEGKAYIKKCAREFEEKMSLEEERRKEIFSNYDYINWLDKFTLEHKSFFDDDWVYTPEKISEEDNIRVNSLNLFFEGVEKYANGMNLECSYFADGYGLSYKVRLNDAGFVIGIIHGQGVHTTCERVPIDNENDFIDIGDVISFGSVNPALNDLSQVIRSAYRRGCTREEILDFVNSTVQELSMNESEKNLGMKRLNG